MQKLAVNRVRTGPEISRTGKSLVQVFFFLENICFNEAKFCMFQIDLFFHKKNSDISPVK